MLAALAYFQSVLGVGQTLKQMTFVVVVQLLA